jgi:hypothetical protein
VQKDILYLVELVDLVSKNVLIGKLSYRPDTELILDVLDAALEFGRRPEVLQSD